MNKRQQNMIWFKFKLTIAYLGLGLGSALVALILSQPFSGWIKTLIRLIVFVAGFYIIEITVEEKERGEGDP